MHAKDLLEFTEHVSKEAFTFGGRKYMLLDASGFVGTVYNAVSNKFNHKKCF